MPYCNHHKNKNKNTIKIPDKLWDKINILLPTEKSNNTVGRPTAVPFRKVFNGIVYVLRTEGCYSSGRCYLLNMALIQLAIGDFSSR